MSRLTIIGYNLHDYGKSTPEVRQGQHELLMAERPNVVCLQEIWDDRDDLSQLRRHVATLADALGMSAMAVPAPRSHCHLALLWRPEYAVLSQGVYGWDLWHGLGVVVLDVGAAVPLRVGVTHLAPWDPDRRLADTRTVAALLGDPATATVIGGDWNLLRSDDRYDPEPGEAASVTGQTATSTPPGPLACALPGSGAVSKPISPHTNRGRLPRPTSPSTP